MGPRIIIAHGRKYEPDHLVDDFRENFAWADGFAEIDCRDRQDELWIDERDLYARQRQLAGELGADWILITAPDERLEKSAEQEIRAAIEGRRDRAYKFPVLEMHSPTAYRTDGKWAKRVQTRLFPYDPKFLYDNKKLHNNIAPRHPRLRPVLLKTRLYHLKHIEPENRWVRRQVFEKLDPKNRFQSIGYKYLDDIEGMTLQEIEPGREFVPPYTKKYIFAPPKELYDNL